MKAMSEEIVKVSVAMTLDEPQTVTLDEQRYQEKLAAWSNKL